jgi:hypothetical protein
MKKPVHRAFVLADAINQLTDIESELADLQNSDTFRRFSTRQKAEYRECLCRLRDLIHDLEQDCAQEQLAS